MASMPFQVLLMQIRRTYRWEDPTKTAMWLAGYIICWGFGQLGGAAVSRELSLLSKAVLPPLMSLV